MKQNFATETKKPSTQEDKVSSVDATAPIKDAREIFGIASFLMFTSTIDYHLKPTLQHQFAL